MVFRGPYHRIIEMAGDDDAEDDRPPLRQAAQACAVLLLSIFCVG